MEGCEIVDIDSLTRVDVEILLAYAEGKMRVRQAHLISYYGEPTICNHLKKIKAKTGIDPETFDGLVILVNSIKERMNGADS